MILTTHFFPRDNRTRSSHLGIRTSHFLPLIALLGLTYVQVCPASASPTTRCQHGTYDTRTCVSGAELIANINSGRSYFERSFVTGIVDFSRVRGTLKYLKLNDCVFENNPHFGRVLPATMMDFSSASVLGVAGKISLPSSTLLQSLHQTGPISLSGFQIRGDLVLSRPMPDVRSLGSPYKSANTPSALALVNVDFDGEVFAHSAVFQGEVLIDHCVFRKDVNFLHARFEDWFTVSNTIFESKAVFSGARFQKHLTTFSATFLRGVDFQDTVAEAGLSLDGSRFPAPPSGNLASVLLVRSASAQYLSLRSIDSDIPIQIIRTVAEEIYISGHYSGVITIVEPKTTKIAMDDLVARRVEVGGMVDGPLWIQTSSIDDIDLSHAAVKQPISLSTSNIGRFKLGPLSYNTVLSDWPQLRSAVVGDSATLLSIEASYRRLGNNAWADDAYYERKKAEYRNEIQLSRVGRFLFLDLSCGFGVRPLRTIPYAIAVIIIFAVVFAQPRALVNKGNASPLFSSLSFFRRLLAALQFSSACFLRASYTEWEPSSTPSHSIRLSFRKRPIIVIPLLAFRVIALLEAGLSWFLLALFIATYTRLIFR
jgi:hypothetical protein